MKNAAYKQSVDDFINEIRGEMKEANARIKTAMNAGDDTSHPSGSEDNGTQSPSSGSHSSANTSAVKKLVGEEAVESASDASTSEKQDSVTPYGDTVGKGEIPSAQAKLPDPGTSLSEAKTAEYANMSYEDARDRTVKLANALLAIVIAEKDEPVTKKANSPAATAVTAPVAKEAAAGEDEGPALVDYVAQQVDTQIKLAYTLADMLAAEIAVQKKALKNNKRASEDGGEGGDDEGKEKEEGSEEEEPSSPSAPVEEKTDAVDSVSADPTEDIFNSLLQDPGAGAAAGAGAEMGAGADPGLGGGGGVGGGAPAPAGPGAGGLPGGDAGMGLPPELSGGAGAGDAGMGADPMAALGGGADPMAGGAGGDPMGGGAMSQDEALQELIMALIESGISPEQLGAASPQGQKLAADIRTMKKAGKFKIEVAKTATHRKLRDRFKNYLREVVKD
jgi:hypothetical protein